MNAGDFFNPPPSLPVVAVEPVSAGSTACRNDRNEGNRQAHALSGGSRPAGGAQPEGGCRWVCPFAHRGRRIARSVARAPFRRDVHPVPTGRAPRFAFAPSPVARPSASAEYGRADGETGGGDSLPHPPRGKGRLFGHGTKKLRPERLPSQATRPGKVVDISFFISSG